MFWREIQKSLTRVLYSNRVNSIVWTRDKLAKVEWLVEENQNEQEGDANESEKRINVPGSFEETEEI